MVLLVASKNAIGCLVCFSGVGCFVVPTTCGTFCDDFDPCNCKDVYSFASQPSTYLYSLNGQAFLTHEGSKYPVLSDAGVAFLTKEIKNYSRFKGTKAEKTTAIFKELAAFLKNDNGFVSEKSLGDLSKKEGIRINNMGYNNPPISGLSIEITTGGRSIRRMTTDKQGKFSSAKIDSGIYQIKISNPTGKVPDVMTITINENFGILCCCPGPPCEEEIELVVGGAPTKKNNTIYVKSRADLVGQLKIRQGSR